MCLYLFGLMTSSAVHQMVPVVTCFITVSYTSKLAVNHRKFYLSSQLMLHVPAVLTIFSINSK